MNHTVYSTLCTIPHHTETYRLYRCVPVMSQHTTPHHTITVPLPYRTARTTRHVDSGDPFRGAEGGAVLPEGVQGEAVHRRQQHRGHAQHAGGHRGVGLGHPRVPPGNDGVSVCWYNWGPTE